MNKSNSNSQLNVKPIFLPADSQVLFCHGKQGLFMERVRKLMEKDKPGGPFKAAHIGASNGDKPEYYNIFLAAMNQVGYNLTVWAKGLIIFFLLLPLSLRF